MSALSLGTAQFGLPYGVANQRGQISLDDARAILRCAESAGIDTLDTAIAYGDSEDRLGEIGVASWQVISKLPGIPEDCTDVATWVSHAVEASLCRLGISQLRVLLLHCPAQLLSEQGEVLYAALAQQKRNGLVKKIGVSIYEPDELNALCLNFDFDVVQAPFNIFDRRMIDSGWLVRLSQRGIEVHVRSVFLQGLLLQQPVDRPIKFQRWRSLWDC